MMCLYIYLLELWVIICRLNLVRGSNINFEDNPRFENDILQLIIVNYRFAEFFMQEAK